MPNSIPDCALTASAWWFNAAFENAFVDIAINRAVACYLVSIIICFVSRYDKPILYSCGSCKRSSINRACRRHFTLHIRVCMAAPACPPFNYKNRDGENDADEPHHDHWYNPGNSIISSCFSQVKILSQLTCRCWFLSPLLYGATTCHLQSPSPSWTTNTSVGWYPCLSSIPDCGPNVSKNHFLVSYIISFC